MMDGYKNYSLALFGNFALFDPKGFIASEQKDLIMGAVALMLVAVIPAIAMTFFFAWKYRAGNNAKYEPTLDRSKPAQLAWLGLLSIIIIILGTTAWKSSHALDPRKPIESGVAPITIQAVALQWKWLFIYPAQNIATVNYIQFPEDTPINFEITADAPMNSFWIPQLGGQMYAMNGMKTKLHLMANETGEYRGFSSNISGEGFSGMSFTAKASSQTEFDIWVETVRMQSDTLDYDRLASPSKNNSVAYYIPDPGLFDSIIMKFMPTAGSMEH